MARTILDLGKNLHKNAATWKTTFDQKIEALYQDPRNHRTQTRHQSHYLPKAREGKDAPENGIIKTIPKDQPEAIFVVYDCNNDWDNYKDYTAALTKIEDLKIGWVE